jgi:hypothetical protein
MMNHRFSGGTFFCLAVLLFLLCALAAPDYGVAQSGDPLSCITSKCTSCSAACFLNIQGTECSAVMCMMVPTCDSCKCAKYVNQCCCY